MPKGKSQQSSCADTCIRHCKTGLGREVRAALLRVRTRPECHEGTLRELT